MNALSFDYNSLFFQGIKILYSEKSEWGNMGFLLFGDNCDEHEIPLFPGYEVIKSFVLGKEKLLMKSPEGHIISFRSYITLFFQEEKVGDFLFKDPYWKSLFFDKDQLYKPDFVLSWLSLFTRINDTSFGSCSDAHHINMRNKYLTLIVNN